MTRITIVAMIHYNGFDHMQRALTLTLLALCLGSPLSNVLAAADEPAVLQLVIKDHRFEPAELKVPAGKRVKLVIHNQDNKAEEFESHALNREKVIPAGAKATVFVGPLKPGRYAFVGEYSEATAKGVLVAE